MACIISEIKEDLQHNFTTRSYTEYAVIRSSLGKNLEKIRIELEYNKNFEITITIHKDNDFIVNFFL